MPWHQRPERGLWEAWSCASLLQDCEIVPLGPQALVFLFLKRVPALPTPKLPERRQWIKSQIKKKKEKVFLEYKVILSLGKVPSLNQTSLKSYWRVRVCGWAVCPLLIQDSAAGLYVWPSARLFSKLHSLKALAEPAEVWALCHSVFSLCSQGSWEGYLCICPTSYRCFCSGHQVLWHSSVRSFVIWLHCSLHQETIYFPTACRNCLCGLLWLVTCGGSVMSLMRLPLSTSWDGLKLSCQEETWDERSCKERPSWCNCMSKDPRRPRDELSVQLVSRVIGINCFKPLSFGMVY